MVGSGPRGLGWPSCPKPTAESRGTGESVIVLGREINDRGAVCAESQVMIIHAALGDYHMDIQCAGSGPIRQVNEVCGGTASAACK